MQIFRGVLSFIVTDLIRLIILITFPILALHGSLRTCTSREGSGGNAGVTDAAGHHTGRGNFDRLAPHRLNLERLTVQGSSPCAPTNKIKYLRHLAVNCRLLVSAVCPKALGRLRYRKAVRARCERLLTGWSLVRIRPGEPNKISGLTPSSESRKQVRGPDLAASMAAIDKFREVLLRGPTYWRDSRRFDQRAATRQRRSKPSKIRLSGAAPGRPGRSGPMGCRAAAPING